MEHERAIRADLLLKRNIRTLLDRRRIEDKDLAVWCGHKPPWISKILKQDRGMKLEDVGLVASFFGLTVSQLFSPGISALTERRRIERRKTERRGGTDRRKAPPIP